MRFNLTFTLKACFIKKKYIYKKKKFSHCFFIIRESTWRIDTMFARRTVNWTPICQDLCDKIQLHGSDKPSYETVYVTKDVFTKHLKKVSLWERNVLSSDCNYVICFSSQTWVMTFWYCCVYQCVLCYILKGYIQMSCCEKENKS